MKWPKLIISKCLIKYLLNKCARQFGLFFFTTNYLTGHLKLSLFIHHEGLTHRLFSYVCFHSVHTEILSFVLSVHTGEIHSLQKVLGGICRMLDVGLTGVNTPSLPSRSLRELKSEQMMRAKLVSVVNSSTSGHEQTEINI